ncbi:MAG: hypothetical protein ACUVX1_14385 [Chloroflexota bacterium]
MGKPRSRGSGEGTIFQLPSGKWRAELYLGVDGKTGKRQVWRCDRQKRSEAAEELAQAIAERAKGKLVIHSRQTFETYAQWWLENVAAISVRPSSLQTYQSN